MREDFEKLPEISFRLGLVYFSEGLNIYLSKVYGCDVDIGYINGSWYAYQEQQKKIDKAIEYLDSIEGLVWYEQIKELLK